MQNQHFSRLLRLARRTGDRLIVTDEQGGEPIVILPIDEYEALIDAALGPDFGEETGDRIETRREMSGGGESERPGIEEDEEDEEELESIEIPVIEEAIEQPTAKEVFMAPIVPERGTEEASDEADIDERAIEEFWKKVEPPAGESIPRREEASMAKVVEMPQKQPQNSLMGEERFYLEDIG